MLTISVCMIVRDEEKVLARCLESVKDLADELIIVDTGSKDGTKEIAGRYTKKIYDFIWTDDFAAARNFAFSKAEMDYLMWLDADDVIAKEEGEKLAKLKDELPGDTDIVMMRYVTAFDKNGNPAFSYYRERLIKNHSGFLWSGRVHEAISPAGKVVYSDIVIEHRKTLTGDRDRNLRIYERMIEEGEVLAPREQFYYGRELYYHERYREAIDVFEDFLSGGAGWIENCIEACRHLSFCHQKLGDWSRRLEALFKSFEYDVPRAEVSCDIGECFMEKQMYRRAVFWYELALQTERDDKTGAFVLDDCYGYIPAIQLAVCYDKLGEKEKAKERNRLAGIWKPDSSAYLHNKEYFERIL